MKPGRNDPCPCGSGKKYKKCCQDKFEVPSAFQPMWQKTGAAAKSKAPTYAECNQLVALFNAGHYVVLESQARLLLEQYPDYGYAWKVLGASLQMQGKDALPAMQKATELLPDDVEAHNNLGKVLQELGQLDNTVACFRHALRIKPDYVEAHFNLGVALQTIGQLDDAMASYRRAVEIKPDFSEAHSNLGVVLKDLGQLDDAVMSYRRALEIKSDLAEAHCNLGAVLRSQNKISDAKACFRKAQELGSNGAGVCDALMFPAIMGTRQEMMKSRAEFEVNLNQLMEKAVPLNDPLGSALETNFYLAFHGLNDRDLQVKVAKYYEQACPSLLYTAPHCSRPKSGSQKRQIQIGFLSRYFSDHSVSLCFSKIIETISLRGPFEVTLISNRPIDEIIYSGAAGKRVCLSNDLTLDRKMIAALELDILVYLDIGMEPLSYFLAFSRLARVQCVLGGHPVTTGITNMDYFLSADLMEPLGADDHYSEKLVLLPRPLFYFARPMLPATLKTRCELGLPEGRHIYMCPMRLQKMHPDFDEAISRILQVDGNGVVVLFEDIILNFGKKILVERFEKTISTELQERIIFLPWIEEKSDFISAIATADVILDPFHFGIGSTAIMAFTTGTPIVTKPGEFMRGRVGMGFCKMMDLPECIAKDTESYVQKAVQIASNQSLRDTISAKILKNSHALYENLQPIDDFADFLTRCKDILE